MKKHIKTLFPAIGSLLFAATTVIAGPPLICHRVDIGNAKSLPWRDVKDWNGGEVRYDVTRLTADTLALLTPATQLNVRMETLRRAAIYSVRKDGLADQLTLQLLARAANSEAEGKPDAMAWFDAGYFVEAMRQMAFIHQYNMLSPEERAQWKWRSESRVLDGKPWIDRAARLGAKGLGVALAKVEEYRQADLKRTSPVAASTAGSATSASQR
jgi:hypothetical protein